MIKVMAKILTGYNVSMEKDFAPSMGAKEDIGRDKGCSLKAGWKTSVLLSNIFYIEF